MTNEYTSLYISKSLTLYFWKGDVCCVWEMSGDEDGLLYFKFFPQTPNMNDRENKFTLFLAWAIYLQSWSVYLFLFPFFFFSSFLFFVVSLFWFSSFFQSVAFFLFSCLVRSVSTWCVEFCFRFSLRQFL